MNLRLIGILLCSMMFGWSHAHQPDADKMACGGADLVFRPSTAPANQIQSAIEKAQAYILSQKNKDGNWEQAAEGTPGWGDRTCLAVYALCASGIDSRSEDVKPGFEFVTNGTFLDDRALGFNSQLTHCAFPGKSIEAMAKRDLAQLIAPIRGANPYSAFSALGIHAIGRFNGGVPLLWWLESTDRRLGTQQPDGSWNSEDPGQSTFAATAGGVFALLAAEEAAASEKPPVEVEQGGETMTIRRAIDWLDKHFDKSIDDPADLYWIAQISRMNGRKNWGGKDWRQAAVSSLLNNRRPDGSFGMPGDPLSNTCYGLLILSQIHLPILINKLCYKGDSNDTTAEPWNERPHDAAQFASWMGHELCFDFLNWQVVDLSKPVESLVDAPILYISGSAPFNFTAAEQAKLRAFCQHGGLILGNANRGSPQFKQSFIELTRRLFPQYEMRPVYSDVLIYREFIRSFRAKPRLLELSNGVRKLMVLVPDADVGDAWQRRSWATDEAAFGLSANLCVYAMDRLRDTNESRWETPDPAIKAKATLRLARLNVADNWDPEPAGWERMQAILHNHCNLDLAIDPVKPENLASHCVAHLTGTGTLSLTLPQRDAICRFVVKGGTLIVDAAGGDKKFADSFEAEAAAIFPAGKLELLPPDDAIYHRPGLEIGRMPWNVQAIDLDPNHHSPDLRVMKFGGRIGLFFSRQDLSAGLLPHTPDGIIGYRPEAATRLMCSMLLYAAEQSSRLDRLGIALQIH